MKRKLVLGTVCISLALAATSCEVLSDCQSCKWVSTDSSNGDVTEAPEETQYCGAELLTIKTKTTTQGTITTVYKCH